MCATSLQREQPRRARASATVPIKPTVQQVGQPRQATAVRVNSSSDTGPTTAIRKIARAPTTRPATPLSTCSLTEPLASGELLLLGDSGVILLLTSIPTYLRGGAVSGSPAPRAPRTAVGPAARDHEGSMCSGASPRGRRSGEGGAEACQDYRP